MDQTVNFAVLRTDQIVIAQMMLPQNKLLIVCMPFSLIIRILHGCENVHPVAGGYLQNCLTKAINLSPHSCKYKNKYDIYIHHFYLNNKRVLEA